MSDLALNFSDETHVCDVSVVHGDLALANDLRSAVIISLFSWARANQEEVDAKAPRYGWWGDKVDAKNRVLGSKLYLLKREKITAATLAQAETYIRQALAWLIEDGLVKNIDCSVTVNSKQANRVDAAITLQLLTENQRFSFNDLWSAL